MLRRGGLILFLIAWLGIAAILAADTLGITWPWQQQTAEAPPSPGAQPGKQETPAAGTATSQSTTETGKSADTKKAASAIEETTAALSPAQEADAPKQGSVALDISRISPDGPSVFAGRAEPDAYVTVLEDGKPAGTVKADENGEWSLSTEHRFASADPKLSFEASATPPAPPPAPEAPKVAEKAAEPAQRSAAVVANDVMKKFEDLVAKAREEAKSEQQAKPEHDQQAKPEETAKAESATTPDATTQTNPQQQAAAPAQGAESSSSSTERATANAGTSAGSSASATSNTRETDTAAHTTAQASPAPGSEPGKTEAIPVPIMFVYNEATLTPDGKHAANLLLEYLTLKRLSAVELTGHADERGTTEYNMDLSRDRLAAVSDLLKNGGYSGELKLTPKGKSEPFTGVDRERFSGEALYQLDRRVELRVAR